MMTYKLTGNPVHNGLERWYVHGAFDDLCVMYYKDHASMLRHWLQLSGHAKHKEYHMITTLLTDDAGNKYTVFPAFGVWRPGDPVRDVEYLQSLLKGAVSWPYDPHWGKPTEEEGQVNDYEKYIYKLRKVINDKLGDPDSKKLAVGKPIYTQYHHVWGPMASDTPLTEDTVSMMDLDHPSEDEEDEDNPSDYDDEPEDDEEEDNE